MDMLYDDDIVTGRQAVAAEWVDSFFELIHAYDTNDPGIAAALVASWARLWRADRQLLSVVAEVDVPEDVRIGKTLWSEVFEATRRTDQEKSFLDRLPELCKTAANYFSAVAWAGWLRDLREAIDGGRAYYFSDAVHTVDMIDNAELVLWACKKYAREDDATAKLSEEVYRAKQLLFVSRDYLAAACPNYILAVHAAMRWDTLPDLGLEVSQNKFSMLSLRARKFKDLFFALED